MNIIIESAFENTNKYSLLTFLKEKLDPIKTLVINAQLTAQEILEIQRIEKKENNYWDSSVLLNTEVSLMLDRTKQFMRTINEMDKHFVNVMNKSLFSSLAYLQYWKDIKKVLSTRHYNQAINMLENLAAFYNITKRNTIVVFLQKESSEFEHIYFNTVLKEYKERGISIDVFPHDVSMSNISTTLVSYNVIRETR